MELSPSCRKNGRNLRVILNNPSTNKGKEPRSQDLSTKINQKVLIGGEKLGILKYFGPVHVSAGFFCGIELDEPDGKHDGILDGNYCSTAWSFPKKTPRAFSRKMTFVFKCKIRPGRII